MTRDLMPDLLRFHERFHEQNEFQSDISERDYLLAIDDEYSDGYLPEHVGSFLRKVTGLHYNIEQVQMFIDKVKKYQGEIISEIHKDKRLHEEYDMLIEKIKRKSSTINQHIKELKVMADNDKVNGYITIEGKMKRDQVNVLILMFQDVMGEFNTIQLDHRDHCKSRIKRQFEICGENVDNEEIEEMIEKGDLNAFTQKIGVDVDDFTKTQSVLKEVEDRHADILKLEQSITELFDIFQEIAILVEMQGGLIDSIQHNVQETITKVEESSQELKKAMRYKQKNFLTCCCRLCTKWFALCCYVGQSPEDGDVQMNHISKE